jgi:hypothetical protein
MILAAGEGRRIFFAKIRDLSGGMGFLHIVLKYDSQRKI